MKPVLKYCFSSLVLFCLYLTATQIASSQTKRFDLDASTKLVRLSAPNISPDGKSIVVVATRVDQWTTRCHTAALVAVGRPAGIHFQRANRQRKQAANLHAGDEWWRSQPQRTPAIAG